MRTIATLFGTCVLVFGLSLPAHAQTNTVTLSFRVTVQGTACPNATFWGAIGVAGGEYLNFVQLTDPEGDGIYTGTLTHTAGQWLVRLIQGQGVARPDPAQVSPPLGQDVLLPGDPWQIIRDFGTVPLTENMVFEGSVVGCPAGLPDTGRSGEVRVIPITGAVLLLASAIYLRRRMRQHA